MIRLHYYPSNASMAPHILLRELGLPFELVRVDREQQAHKAPAYLTLNPNGQIPVLEDGPLVLYETAAILMHLADTHPPAGLLPPIGPAGSTQAAERAQCLKWLVWLTNTLQATLMLYFYPERWVDEGQAEAARQVQQHAQAKVAGLLAQLDAQLAASGGPWLMGAAYRAADPMAFMLCRWTRGFAGGAGAPARTWPHIGPYLQRMLDRPAVQQALAAEGLAEPWV